MNRFSVMNTSLKRSDKPGCSISAYNILQEFAAR